MTQQRLNLGMQKNLKHVPPSSPNLLINSPNLQTQILHKQNSKRLTKILYRTRCHTRTLHSVFHNIQLHNFFQILVTYFLHRTKSFVLNRTSRKFCTLYFFICQRHKTVNEFRQCGDNCTQSKRERLICGYGNSVQCLNQTWIHC